MSSATSSLIRPSSRGRRYAAMARPPSSTRRARLPAKASRSIPEAAFGASASADSSGGVPKALRLLTACSRGHSCSYVAIIDRPGGSRESVRCGAFGSRSSSRVSDSVTTRQLRRRLGKPALFGALAFHARGLCCRRPRRCRSSPARTPRRPRPPRRRSASPAAHGTATERHGATAHRRASAGRWRQATGLGWRDDRCQPRRHGAATDMVPLHRRGPPRIRLCIRRRGRTCRSRASRRRRQPATARC